MKLEFKTKRNRYELTQDKYCYHLSRYEISTKGKNIGKEILITTGYYKNISQIAEKLLDLELLVVDDVSDIKAEISASLKSIKEGVLSGL